MSRLAPSLPRTDRAATPVLLLTVALVSVLAAYTFSRMTGWIAERVEMPVGTPALFLALVVAVASPARYGMHRGQTVTEWRLVLSSLAVVAAVVLMFRAVSGPAPYEATWAEVVVVPLGEELLFRGVVLGLVLAVLSGQGMRHARAAAVVVSALAFGLGHLGNLGYVPVEFLAVQVVAATLFGLLAGWVRVRTDSVAGPMALHMVMNGVAVL